MQPFLQNVAQTFLNEYDTDIRQFSFVFPNRRAGLFFQRYLADIAQKPLFSPEILTINDCFLSASQWKIADRLGNLFRLYRIFIHTSKLDETFDSFVFWGEMLLNDFDEVDKYRIDARQLFVNVTELREIEELFVEFSPRQLEAIRSFWSNFQPQTKAPTQEYFMATWKILYPVYEQFRNELISSGEATEGMICRDVVEQLKQHQLPLTWTDKKFVFVGFNALNPCEKSLMIELQNRDMADFYWDYTAPELMDVENPASLFFAENTHIFTSKHQISSHYLPADEKNWTLTAVPSAIGQTHKVYDLLNEIYPHGISEENWTKTAVILPDEKLLMPMLHAIPEQISRVNVTMGYPIQITPISGFIEHLFELQKRKRIQNEVEEFYYRNILSVLNHQYIISLFPDDIRKIVQDITLNNRIYLSANSLQINPLFTLLFKSLTAASEMPDYLLNILRILLSILKSENQKADYQLTADIIYAFYTAINRISGILAEVPEKIEFSFETLARLVKQLTNSITIPFIGEPLNGLQIMGVLETRGIDFENIIITSFNEGVFPAKQSANSFIPYNLRKGFGLPTFEQTDAILSYNFYRLISRARNIHFIYDSRTEGVNTGEVSRFYHQLNYHYGVRISENIVEYEIAPENKNPISVFKTDDVIRKLQLFMKEGEDGKALSASSLNTYLDCPLKFYLTSVEKTGEPDEVTEMIQDSMFGTLFHAAMQNIYQSFLHQIVTPDDLKRIIADKNFLSNQINKAFATHYFHRKDEKVLLEGNNLLIGRVLLKYVTQVLQIDMHYAPFRYLDSERKCKISFPIDSRNVNIKGFVDRIDEKDGVIRILDYKTGKGNLSFKSMDDVFDTRTKDRPKFVLQTFLYGLLLKDSFPVAQMQPGVYFMRDVFKSDFSTSFKMKPLPGKIVEIDCLADYEQDFSAKLKSCLEEIYNPEIPFHQTLDSKTCEYCAYNVLCRK